MLKVSKLREKVKCKSLKCLNNTNNNNNIQLISLISSQGQCQDIKFYLFLLHNPLQILILQGLTI